MRAETKPALTKHTDIKKGEYLDSTFNLCNSVIGGGILTIPYAVKSSGVGLVLIFAVIFAFMVDQSIFYLVKASFNTDCDSYEALALKLFDRNWMIATRVSKAFLCFFACIGYLIAMASAVKPMFKDWWGNDSIMSDRKFIVFLFLIPTYAIACLPTLYSVRWVSYGAVLSVLFICVIVFIKASEQSASDSVEIFDFGTSSLSSFGLFFFAFGCHLSSIVLYNEMRDRSPERFRLVIHSTMVITFFLYLSMGIAGYLNFGDDTESNIMDNYNDDKDPLIDVAVSLLLFFIIVHYYYYISTHRHFLHTREYHCRCLCSSPTLMSHTLFVR